MKNVSQTINLLEKSTHYYIICTDMTGNYSYINSNYANRFHHVDTNFVGKPFYITMHPDDVAVCSAAGRLALENKDLLAPATIRKHDGSGGYIITQWEFKGMFDDKGNPEGVFCLGYDITEFIDQLKTKDNLLDDIAFSQSHIIRRPVANIMGVVFLLQQEYLNPEIKELLEILIQNTSELDAIIRQVAHDIRS
jgi:hypothetical protein